MLNHLNDLNLLNTIIGKYVKINVQKFRENELRLHSLIQVGDLVHKAGFLYALILPRYDHLILLHIRGIQFCAIAYFDNHTEYVIALHFGTQIKLQK